MRKARPTSPLRLPALPKHQPAARSRCHPEAARGRRPHHRAHRHAARRNERSRASASSRSSSADRSARARWRASRRSCSAAMARPIEAQGLKWELLRLDQRWQWYSRDGSWNYEPIVNARRIAAGAGEAAGRGGQDRGARRLGPLSPGGERRPDGTLSSLVFNVGYWADEAADSPEVLDVALDKPSYRIGDSARSKLPRAWPGRAMIAVLNSGLASTQEVDLPAGGGEVPIRVGDDWGPGAYVTVMLYRPMDEKAKRMPSRALGPALARHRPDAAHRSTSASTCREKVKSGAILTVPIKVAGLAAGEEARVTVAAIDVGILNLTRFETPKPRSLVLRPAPARHRDPRPLRPPDRRHARRTRQAALRRRRRLRRHVHAGQRRRWKRRWPCSPASSKSAPMARAKVEFQLPDFNGTRARFGRRLERRQGRLRHQGRDRARSGGAHGVGARASSRWATRRASSSPCTTSKARPAPTRHRRPAGSRRRAARRRSASSAPLPLAPASASARPSSSSRPRSG